MSRSEKTNGYWFFSWFIESLIGRATRTDEAATRTDEADRAENTEVQHENIRRAVRSPNNRLQHQREQQSRTHNSNARVGDRLEKECQTEVQTLDLRASNRSFQAAKSGSYENTFCKGGAASSTTTPPTVSSTDEEPECCPICFFELVTQKVGTPAACKHNFCVDCLQKWVKKNNTCPIDRQVCRIILVRHCLGGKVVRRIYVKATNRKRSHR